MSTGEKISQRQKLKAMREQELARYALVGHDPLNSSAFSEGVTLNPRRSRRQMQAALDQARCASDRMVADDRTITRLIIEYAEMAEGPTRHFVLRPGVGNADSKLTKDLKGIVTVNSEAKYDRDVMVPLPWAALHGALTHLSSIRKKPQTRLHQLSFVSEAYRVATDEFVRRLAVACDDPTVLPKRLLSAPTPIQLIDVFTTVAEAVSAPDPHPKRKNHYAFEANDHLRGFRWGHQQTPVERMLDNTQHLKRTFAQAHNGRLPKSVRDGYENLLKTLNNMGLAM